MGTRYRSWEERRQIIRAIIADSNAPPLSSFQLSTSETVFFRARSAKAIDKLAKETSAFKGYYALPTARPFKYVIYVVAAMIATALCAAIYLDHYSPPTADRTPIFTAFIAVATAAVGWAVSGGIAHRNTVRQNTNSMIFARFSQAPFGEALHRFHETFGTAPVTTERVNALKHSEKEEDRKAAASVGYLLNYYEFIASGVLHGDLHSEIVRDNIRGVICFFYDRCEQHIQNLNRANPRTFKNLIKIRTHYREP